MCWTWSALNDATCTHTHAHTHTHTHTIVQRGSQVVQWSSHHHHAGSLTFTKFWIMFWVGERARCKSASSTAVENRTMHVPMKRRSPGNREKNSTRVVGKALSDTWVRRNDRRYCRRQVCTKSICRHFSCGFRVLVFITTSRKMRSESQHDLQWMKAFDLQQILDSRP